MIQRRFSFLKSRFRESRRKCLHRFIRQIVFGGQLQILQREMVLFEGHKGLGSSQQRQGQRQTLISRLVSTWDRYCRYRVIWENIAARPRASLIDYRLPRTIYRYKANEAMKIELSTDWRMLPECAVSKIQVFIPLVVRIWRYARAYTIGPYRRIF